MQLRRTQRWPVRTVWIILIVGVLVSGALFFVWPALQRQSAIPVTLAELADAPERYAGHLVVVRGHLGVGGLTSDSPCEELTARIVSDLAADGRWRGPKMTLKLAKPITIEQSRLYVEMLGYFRLYQLQRVPNVFVSPEMRCPQEWVIEVVEMRSTMPPTPLFTTAAWLAIEGTLPALIVTR
jgi:hypothetical protein